MDPARLSIRQSRAILFLAAALGALGVWAYVRTPASIVPEMRFSRIDVVADAGDLPPEQVRVAVTTPLEQAFLGLPSVTRVLATSAQGSGELVVEFDPATNVQTDLQYVDNAISQVRAQASEARSIVANVVTPQTEPVLSYALSSNELSQTLVAEYARTRMLPAFYGTQGLGHVLLVGGGQR
ncbi:MAG: efflux RND transporter permease subunit, partial [Candidatus Eremiobacteraeota bacterium]|nr:efflux RND transporter permease subunit [Candidatus Eremiobacteraeota bacterium]